MEVQRVPSLRVDFARDGHSVMITDTSEREYIIPCHLTDSEALEYRNFLKDRLDEVKDSVRGRELTIKQASDALESLNLSTLTLTWQIFRDELERVASIFQKCFPTWRTSTDPVIITVTAELNRFIPIEFLPLFEFSEWPEADDLPTLETAVRRFLGFSAIIRREFRDLSISHDLILQNEPKLPLRCFVYDNLRGANAEVSFFQDNANYIDIDGPWPATKLSRRDFSKAMAAFLRYANQRFDGQIRTPIDQIQHFSCHCEVDESISSNSILRLANGNEVKISDLQAYFAILSGESMPQSGPLIFLNACGSSRMNPMSATSFPRFFLEENRNRGFIGTETNVPDSFAAEFSQRFYQGLLGGLSLGKAIHYAKWAMLQEKKNPLGILYTIYADPDLHVSKPVDAVTR